jgi:hypothetical protein
MLQTIYLNRMNKFFRFCVFGVISIRPRITSARVFTLEQILSSLKNPIPALAKTDDRQAPFQAVLQTRYYSYSEREPGGDSSAGINPGGLNGGKQRLFLPRQLVPPFSLLHHPPMMHLKQQLLYNPPAMKKGIEQDSAFKQRQAPLSEALPLWNQRQSPIVKVHYGLCQSGAEAGYRELPLAQEPINAYDSNLIISRHNALIDQERLNADDLKG